MVRALTAEPTIERPAASPANRTDGELLEQFVHGEVRESHDAFRELVGRHGPSVLAVCRRVLDASDDAEDAFQATFLTLVRKGSAITDPSALAAWLRAVAYRIALRTRARASRQRATERQVSAMGLGRDEPANQDEIVVFNEVGPLLREEVARLPKKYRAPVVLSYLQGKTNQEVAELLNWPVGTVKGRLFRARQMLRSRLSRRGVSPPNVSSCC